MSNETLSTGPSSVPSPEHSLGNVSEFMKLPVPDRIVALDQYKATLIELQKDPSQKNVADQLQRFIAILTHLAAVDARRSVNEGRKVPLSVRAPRPSPGSVRGQAMSQNSGVRGSMNVQDARSQLRDRVISRSEFLTFVSRFPAGSPQREVGMELFRKHSLNDWPVLPDTYAYVEKGIMPRFPDTQPQAPYRRSDAVELLHKPEIPEGPQLVPLLYSVPGVPTASYNPDGVVFYQQVTMPGERGMSVTLPVHIRGGTQYVEGIMRADGRALLVTTQSGRVVELPMVITNHGTVREGGGRAFYVDNKLLFTRPLTAEPGGRTVSAGEYRYNAADRPQDILNASPFNTRNMEQIAPGHFRGSNGSVFSVPGAPVLEQSLWAEQVLARNAGQAAMTPPPSYSEKSYQDARSNYINNPYGGSNAMARYEVERNERNFRRREQLRNDIENDRQRAARRELDPIRQRLDAMADFPYATFTEPHFYNPPEMRQVLTSVRDRQQALVNQFNADWQIANSAMVPRYKTEVTQLEQAQQALLALKDPAVFEQYKSDFLSILRGTTNVRSPLSFLMLIGADAERGSLRRSESLADVTPPVSTSPEVLKVEQAMRNPDVWVTIPSGSPGWKYFYQSKGENLFAYSQRFGMHKLDKGTWQWKKVVVPASDSNSPTETASASGMDEAVLDAMKELGGQVSELRDQIVEQSKTIEQQDAELRRLRGK